MEPPIAEVWVDLISTSSATDLGYRALADLASAAADLDYRIIGGHMIQLLIHAYPTRHTRLRLTTDADIGIDRATAAGQQLHTRLTQIGYTANSGNRYAKQIPAGTVTIDVLIPRGDSGKTEVIGGRGYDPIPGLSLAMNAQYLLVHAHAYLADKTELTFAVPVPDIESAVILKALAWANRFADKDIADVASLLEIVEVVRPTYPRWRLDAQPLTSSSRREAAHALHKIAGRLDRGGSPELFDKPARVVALIRRHVTAKETPIRRPAAEPPSPHRR
ncbi:hypothetical protein [Antrihabitans cavernicola]|uniref:Nucleotidyl transferase AbiEii/AbiGii toxin family protein n=1 Tax=Antrihabitans cavernicola TaxID=2495913 RepID=A0A5A7S4S3_9NOCA|nr:hypothetical protein [Spelaeibacter cavernicola]KAA0015973.1 hypothetical protein FOY51_26835 [Spelaeibacter cavernicola]